MPVQDTYSRLIVGWSMATHMRAPLVVDALKMAPGRWRPQPGLITLVLKGAAHERDRRNHSRASQIFSVVAVKDSALHPGQRSEALLAAQAEFGPRTAIIGERHHATYGPTDIVEWLKGIHPAQLPWREFTFPA